MDNHDLYKLTLTILRKEGSGNIIKPDRFTELLKQCHHEYYTQEYDKWDVTQKVHDSLRPFLVVDDTATFTTGVEDLDDLAYSYRHISSARVTTDDTPIDIVTPLEWNYRMDDELTQPTLEDPVMIVDTDALRIRPSSITEAYVTYLKEADNEPFYDYYIDANRNVQWMGVNGATYTLGANEVYRDGTTSGTVTSINRELEWADKDKINILSFIIEKLGVSLQGGITQYALQKESQQNIA